MATSSSYDFNLTGTEIITEALELIGVADAEQTISSEDQETCLRSLNMMIKAWQGEGIALWKNVEATLFPSYQGYSFSIGPSGDHCSSLGYKTEIATVAVSGASEVIVDSDDNIADDDYIGIELDDKTVQWTTVNGAPTTNTVTLTDVLTDDVAVDNHVYNYTSLIQRPLEIVEARVVTSDGSERPLSIKSRDEYLRISNKDTCGTPIQIYYDPLRTNGKMWVWQGFSDVKEYIKFTCRIPIEDFDVAANDPDFPQEWLLALSWNLAVLVAPKFGAKLDPVFILQAQDILQSAKDFDHEHTSVYFKVK